MNRNFVIAAATLGVAAIATSASAQIVFTENFDDGNAGDRWGIATQTERTAAPSTNPDGSVNFAFDYSSLMGIEANPNTGFTPAAWIQVNNTDQTGDEGETYAIFPQNFSLPTGDWKLTADMWVWNDLGISGAGTTELGMIGAYIDRSDPVAPYQWGNDGGPLAWIYSGEGGSAADLARFTEGGAGDDGYAAISDYNAWPENSIPGFETGVSGSAGPAVDNPNGSWVEVSIEKEGDLLHWMLNGAIVDTYDNSGGFYSTGEDITFLLGTTDPFNSVNPDGGTLIDNVVFTIIPEPTSLALLGLGGLTLLRRRR